MFHDKSLATYQTVRNQRDYYYDREMPGQEEILKLLEATLTFLVQKTSGTNANDKIIKSILDNIMLEVKRYSKLSGENKDIYPLEPLTLCQLAIQNRFDKLRELDDEIYKYYKKHYEENPEGPKMNF